ncbi:MAG: tetratricopeptide repeat protein [Phycisphaerales bacterium]
MTEHNPEHLRRLFDLAIKAASSDRGPLLDRECAGDMALREQVVAMIAAAEVERRRFDPTGALYEVPPTADAAVAASFSVALREGSGTQIGPYKLLRLIGEGGFGSVFMAEQEKPIARTVALKIIKVGMDTRQVLARFEQERQALAMMDHPNIARVLDAGATETGRPYFVMDLVRGEPIVDYCDKHSVSIEARLDLFAQVCTAVQHAHSKGIIHRDIKPSNILVSVQDGRAHIRLIDFGIAKATASKLTEKTLFTEHRQFIGTPEYMSPEQAEGNLDIDTRTDVYSLGVLLYELLTGTTPFSGTNLRSAAYAEIQRIIREVEPPKPSTRLSRSADSLASVAAKRNAAPKRLGLMVRGELDWIVMKALEKERASRYETADGLAMEVRRYLCGEAVLAAPPGKAYRFKKFVRRNKGPVAAGLLVSATLVMGLIGTSVGLVRAERARAAEAEQRRVADEARAEAVKQADEAKRQSDIAEAVATFQTDMLEAVNPERMLGDKVTVLQTMEAAVEQLDVGAVKDQPLVEAGVRNAIGMTFQSLGRYVEAESNLRQSLKLRREALPPGHPDIATGLNNLALLLEGHGNLDEAEALYVESLAIRRAAFPSGHAKIATALNNLALLLHSRNRLTEAERFSRDALSIRRDALRPGHPRIGNSLNNLAIILQSQLRLAEAEPLLREALEIGRAALPAGHPDIAAALDNLAKLLRDQNKLAEAEPLMREAMEIRRRAFPAGHLTIATGLNNLGSVLRVQNKLNEAEPLFREALTIYRSSLPAGDKRIVNSLDHLALLLQEQHKLTEAEALKREALSIRRASLPAGDADFAKGLNGLATVLQDQNRLAEAEPLFREALAILRTSLPDSRIEVSTCLNNLGMLLQTQNKLGEAESLHREALEIRRAALPAGSLPISASLTNLAVVLRLQGKLVEAEPLFREALEINRKAYREGDPRIAKSLGNLASLYWSQGKLDQSVPMFEEVLKSQEVALGRDHPDTLWNVANLGVNYKDAGRIAEAIPLLEEAYRASRREPSVARVDLQLLDAYTKSADPAKPESIARLGTLMREMLDAAHATLPKGSPELAGRLSTYGQTLLSLRAWAEAEPMLRECLAIRKNHLPDDWRTFNTMSMLGAALLGQSKLAEAEPLLLDGYTGLKERQAAIPPESKGRIPAALERLVRLYETNGNEPEAAAWRTELEAARAK